jgi:hypothetical protein
VAEAGGIGSVSHACIRSGPSSGWPVFVWRHDHGKARMVTVVPGDLFAPVSGEFDVVLANVPIRQSRCSKTP